MSQRVDQFVAYFRSLRPEADTLKPSHVHILEIYESWLSQIKTPLSAREADSPTLSNKPPLPAPETPQP